MHKLLMLLLCSACFFLAVGQGQKKRLRTYKVSAGPRMDGLLDDSVWRRANVADGFVNSFPKFGEPSIKPSAVKVVYTREALYIGAFLSDSLQDIRRQFTPRDGHNFKNTDYFAVSLDTYNDKQNAFVFFVTPANVQSDMRLNGSNSSDEFQWEPDLSWDAVWQSKTSLAENGWTVEIRIPWSAIRFNPNSSADWGLNFFRHIRKVNERSYWNPINPAQSGSINQYGILEGIEGLEPPLRLSLLPYITAGYRNIPTNAGVIKNPIINGGMDLKYGINESFTLDLTLIPDFGQVQSDNVVLNLSPYEIQFEERRPFFTEGAELFNRAGIFYTRRVGATPSGYGRAYDYAQNHNLRMVKNPSATRLYNAFKLSGRTQKNLGIGLFNAVTAPMHAVMENARGEKTEFETEPLANYNVFVLDQTLKNRSSVGFTNTNVVRSGAGRDANVSALDLSLYDKTNTYLFMLGPRLSMVYDSTATTGWANFTGFQKVSGEWQFELLNNIESDTYNPNDLGLLRAPNEMSFYAEIKRRQFNPGKWFNSSTVKAAWLQEYLYKPMNYVKTELMLSADLIFKNFWDVTLEINSQPVWAHDYFDLRTPGLMTRKPPFMYFGLFGSTDSRKPLFIGYGLGFADLSPIKDDPYFQYEFNARYRFGNKLSATVALKDEKDKGNIGFSHFDGMSKPVIGRRAIKRVESTALLEYNFKARMELSVRARHYWGKAKYSEFYTPKADGWWDPRPFEPGHDQNFNSFNIDAFYTWDFVPGSRLLIAWKNALGPDVYVPGMRYKNYASNFGQMLRNPHSNEISVKLIYFLDVNDLRLKKSNL